jgi:hypothetical protein
MKIIYKMVKVPIPHCGKCKAQLTGNGSIISPYECSCGVWEYSWSAEEHVLIKKRKNAKAL